MSIDWNLNGSRWWKFDFHTHTPASECFGQGSNQELLKSISPRDWLLNYMKAGIDCVAITDHNSGEWIDKLKSALYELNLERPPNYRELYLFPGVEINVNGGFHILAILPEEMTKKDIDYLLGAIKCGATPGKCDKCTVLSIIEVIDEIVSKRGIAIPAHVDSDKGIFRDYDSHTLEQIFDSENVYAIELINKDFSYPELYTEKKLIWSTVLGSDSHHPDNLNGCPDAKFPGSHYTWIKMSKPTINGLRLALLDGNSLSIIRSDEEMGNPNVFHHMIIEEMIVVDAKYIGRGKGREFSCRFNPWLNTIIGGRGTGKSTILEFMRLCLDRRDEIPKALKSDFDKYCEISGRECEGLLTSETKITIFIRKDGVRFKILWNSGCHEAEILEEKNPDNWEIVDGDIKQRFPISIFCQKQIFESSKDPQALIKIIDGAVKVGYREWEEKKNQLVSQFLSFRAQIREQSQIFERESEIRGELDDIDHKLRLFENEKYSDTLRKYLLAQKQDDAITKWKKTWIKSDEELRQLCRSLIPTKIDDKNIIKISEFQEIQEKIILDFTHVQEELQKVLVNLEKIIENGEKSIGDLTFIQQNSESIQKYMSLKIFLEKNGIYNLDEYDELIKRKQILIEGLERIDFAKIEVDKLKTASDSCLQLIKVNRAEISKNRKLFLNDLLSDNKSVSIQVIPFGDKTNVKVEFRKLIEIEEGRFDQDVDYLFEKFYNKPNDSEISSLKDSINKIRSGDYSDTKDQRFGPRIKDLSPEKIDRIMCFFPDDTLNVRYYDFKQDKYVSIKQGSPGQKNAAILAFLLIYGNDPLILDQPEDDLDNQLIYNSIVAQLKDIKRNRQVIIVTHNANVVVNGDSENVIPFTVDTSAQTVIQESGGLQEQGIRNKICDILEGGNDAFKSRYKRINVDN